jgi:hypothetical protein
MCELLGKPPLLERQNTVMQKHSPDHDYYRQAIQVYNRAGNLVTSKFIEMRRVSTGYKMCLVLNKEIIYPHAFEEWEWSYDRDDYCHNGKFKVVDLCTGNVLPGWEYHPEEQKLVMTSTDVKDGFCPLCKKMASKYCATCECVSVIQPVERDLPDYHAYSVALLECLHEDSLLNTPMDKIPFYEEYYKSDSIYKNRLPGNRFEEEIVENAKEDAMKEIDLAEEPVVKGAAYRIGYWSRK